MLWHVSELPIVFGREQDGEGAGGHGVHCSPWIHQEYSFKQRSACRTPAESRQEYLTNRKEYIASLKTCRMTELGGKTGVLGLGLPSVGRGTE